MIHSITHDVAAERFETQVEGEHCVLGYRKKGGSMVIEHVRVPTAVEGRGIAAALTQAALATARTEGWSVVPHCPYVAAYIQRHPSYLDLLRDKA